MAKLRGKTRSQQLAEDLKRAVDGPVPGTRTQQQFKADCDLNPLMQRYLKQNPRDRLGFGIAMQVGMGQSGDGSLTLDLAEALNIVNSGTEEFLRLPSDIRDRFNNDPVKLSSFLSKAENQEEAYRLGLAVKPVPPPEPPVTRVHVVQTDLVDQSQKGPEGPKNAPVGGS